MKSKILKNIVFSFLVVLGIILIFSFIDYLIHLLSKEYAVPSRYFTNKIIYGTLVGFVSYLFLRKRNVIVMSFVFSLVVSVLLQVRYFLEGYSTYFVFLFLIIHFIILWPVSWLVFKLFKRTLNKTIKE